MAYRVTDTIIVDQSRNLSSIGIATFSGPVVVGVGTSTRLSVTGDVNISGIVTGSVLVAAKDSGTGIATDSTESIFGNGWRLSAPASTTYYRLATLPAGGAGNTFDHLIINGTLGSWTSNNQTPFEIYFSNRGSFNTKYISYGSVRSDVRILGISTNSTIEIWAQHQASQFTKLVYNITNSLQVIPVNNPVSTTTAPVGTTVFDSSTATPRFIINDSDNVGIGTTNPTSRLQVQGDVSIASTVGIGTVIDIVPYDTLNSGTLSFEGSAGQLFSITNNLTSGSIFSVNDVSGIPSIDVDANGTIQLGSYGGNIGIGTTNPTSKLDVVGNVKVVGIVTATSFVGNGSQLTGITAGAVGAISGITVRDSNNTVVGTSGSVTQLTFGSGLSVTGTTGAAGIATITLSGNIVGTSLSISGISTLGITLTTNLTSQSLNVSGVSTFAGVTDFTGGTTSVPAIRVRSSGNNWAEGLAIHPSTDNNYALAFFRTKASLSDISSSWGIGNIFEGTNNFALLRNGLTGGSGIRVDSVFDVTQAGVFRFGFNPTVGSNTILHAGNYNAYSSFSGVTTASRFVSNVATGTAPLTVSSTTKVTNLNVDLLDDNDSTYYTNASNLSSGIVPAARITASSGDFNVGQNLNVTGNISVGGTSVILNAATLQIKDKDIVLGITTNASNQDVSTDITANHGGVAIASTQGTPLIDINAGVGTDTIPSTYKQIMWLKSGSWTGLGTDAWLFNYGVGIGSTQVPNGVRLAVGGVQFTQNDLSVVRNINASGVVTATTFVGSLTGAASLNVLKAGDTMTGQLISTLSNNTATGGGQIYLNGATGNRIDFNTNGVAAPTFTTSRSTGTKIVLYPAGSPASEVDFALGIETTALWSSVPASGQQFKWYAGTTNIASLFGTGELVLGTTTKTGTASQPLQVTGGAYVRDNIGIGTTNPSSNLHIQSNAPTITLTDANAAANNKTWINAVNEQDFYWQALNDVGSGGGNLFKFTRSSEQIQTFEGLSSGVSWFTINNSTQRVGIGTTNPSDKLHTLGGNIRVDSATGVVNFWNGAGYYGGIGVAGGLGGSGTDIAIRADSTRSIIFFTGGANDRGRFDASGNLLVGTATSTGTASQPLQVSGGAYVSGNLGVGATAPAFKADIAGDARVTSTNKMRFGGTAGTTNFYIQYNSTTNSLDFVAG